MTNFHERKIRKCKYCERNAKRNITKNGRNKGFYRTCGSEECLTRNYTDPVVNKKKSSSSIKNRLKIGAIRIHKSSTLKGNGKPLNYKVIKIKNPSTWEYEHRYLMEKFLGRKLKKNEHVHHKNENTLDNRLENLELLPHSDHSKLHGKSPVEAQNARRLNGRWSRNFLFCIVCKETKTPHSCHGICRTCYARKYRRENKKK